MAPTPKDMRSTPLLEQAAPAPAPDFNDESIVISGMSGIFPMSNSVNDFSALLYSKTNAVDNKNLRWTQKHPEASEYIGMVPEVDRFDSQFFMVHRRLGEAMDPMARKVLEHSYQAIYDAGMSPKHFYGKKVGVFIASVFSDTEKYGLFDNPSKAGYGITGTSKTMFANRVSYWLNAKGPSMYIDDACCGSIMALEEAVKALKNGTAESAIVGGTNICLGPHSLVHFNRCVKVSPDGKTRSFDENANGCCKSEAISILFLQKAKDAVRAYAEVVHVKNEFISQLSGETGQIFGFVRNPDASAEFLKSFYAEAGVSPDDVDYIEAFGSATPEADKSELLSIEKVFCKNRDDPLLVGSVISNIGLTDAASGATALTKVLLGYHNSLMASNLHCTNPRKDIPALQDGRMRILTEHTPFRGAYAAVSCLSVTGVNSHVLLRRCTKPKDLNRYVSSIPRLLTVSARQHEFIKPIFKSLKMHQIDPEEHALFLNIHATSISGHLGRGYMLVDSNPDGKTIALAESIEYSDDTSRPLWFVYSGMGSQWAGMGAQLMRIPIFAAAIERCDRVLRPQGIDIVHIITAQDKTIFDNVLNSFVGIAAVQIGITDILTALGLRPDNIIGHSVGELGCAYADGCLTAEEMIMSAYSRGQASNAAKLIHGAMAAVGMGYQQLSKLCPPSIDIACHNSETSCTISGPVEAIRSFVGTLTANGVFAKEVPSANIAYHSRYIASAGPFLLNLLQKIIKTPKARSERWVSTSVPQDQWDSPAAKYCSAEYLTNNLLKPVLFEETCTLIPSNAVLVEIAPHGLLQAILKRALPDSCRNIPLTLRGHKDNAQFLLEAIGKLYVEGFNPQVKEIYPKVEYPVSTGTPHLAHHVQWFHDEAWTVVEGDPLTKTAACRTIILSNHDDEYNYLTGNVVQGKMLFSFAGALEAVWDTLAMTLGMTKKQFSVKFQDLHFYSQPIMYDQKQLQIDISLNRGNGKFEVLEGDSKVVTGVIEMITESKLDNVKESYKFDIGADEIYEHFSTRGYSYRDSYRSIANVDKSISAAKVIWEGNWVTFIEGLLQLNVLRNTYQGVSQVSQVREITIDVKEHEAMVSQSEGKKLLTANVDDIFDYTRCGGIQVYGVELSNLPCTKQVSFGLVTKDAVVSESNLTSTVKLTPEKNYVLQIANVGDLDSLHWEEAPIEDEGIEVKVEYAGINISDVNRALGTISFEDSKKYFGMDFSGVTKSGARVMGISRVGAARTLVKARPDLLWPVPAHWTLEDAATVPLAYTQAFYYLCIRSNLSRGMTVLVQGATGALGQAAICIALAYGCRVFATVADKSKKNFLLKLFPDINEDDVGNSRDDSFGDMVLGATKGKGCDIVMSCVRDDLKNASLRCSGSRGITIDLTHFMKKCEKSKFGMNSLTDDRTFLVADFYAVLDLDKSSDIMRLQTLVLEGISAGFVRPLSRVSYSPGHAARAFRLLAASRHRGRALLALRDHTAPVTPRIVCSSNKTQLVLWDGESTGLQLVERLVARGARKVRVYSLRPTSPHLLKLQLWQNLGVDAKIEQIKDLSALLDSTAVQTSLKNIALQGAIEGIYLSLTGGAQDSKIAKVVESFDAASRRLQLPLKYFAVITVEDKVGQQVCVSRSEDKLPATALTLPAYKDCTIDESVWKKAIVDVAEIALCYKDPVLYAQVQNVEQPSVLKLIPRLAEIPTGDVPLKDLGLEDSLTAIQTFLKDEYHVSLTDEDMEVLTKNKILDIEKKSKEPKFEKAGGLKTFFATENYDELRATSDLVSLNTLVADVQTMIGGIDASRPHLFIIPGLEGQYGRFTTMCGRLKLPALVMQPGLERPFETLKDLANRHAKIILDQFRLKDHFYLLGYEYGIALALEIAAILEEHGLTGTVYCIGDGPEEMKTLVETELSSFKTETELQEGIVRHIHSLMAGENAQALDLSGCSSWSERVEACVNALLGRVAHTAQYIRALLTAAHARLGEARRALVTPCTLRSQLIVMRPSSSAQRTSSLQRYSLRPLIVHELAAPMAHAAADLRVPGIINRYLHEDILRAYENSNSCVTYVVYFSNSS